MEEKRKKKKRRPPRKLLCPPAAETLLAEPEFRRWRYHAPGSLKRQAYEVIRRLAAQEKAPGGGGRWVDRV